MEINTNLKKGLLILLGSYLVYWAFVKMKPFGGKSSTKKDKSTASAQNIGDSKKNALIILTAYKNAKDAGESKSFLDEMNAEFAKEYKLRVYSDKGSGKLIATDLEGNKVL
jgi:hypothetical protein